MRLRLPIARRFMVLGVIAVLIGVCVTAMAFLWQEFLILRMAQRAYLGSIIRAAQHELAGQGLTPEMLAGTRDLNAESIVHLQMRLQIVDVPTMIQDLGLRIEIAGPHGTKKGPLLDKTPFIVIHDTALKYQPKEPDLANVEEIMLRGAI